MRENLPLYFFEITNPNPQPYCEVGEIQLWLIKTSSLCCLLVRGGNTLGDIGREVVILGETSAGHCFVLSDLITVNFFKWLWNQKYTLQANLLEKFVSKDYQRYLFSKYEVCNQERDRVRHDAFCPKQTILNGCSWNRLAMP